MKLPEELWLLQPKALMAFQVTPAGTHRQYPHLLLAEYSMCLWISPSSLTLFLYSPIWQKVIEGECRISQFIKWVQQLFQKVNYRNFCMTFIPETLAYWKSYQYKTVLSITGMLPETEASWRRPSSQEPQTTQQVAIYEQFLPKTWESGCRHTWSKWLPNSSLSLSLPLLGYLFSLC